MPTSPRSSPAPAVKAEPDRRSTGANTVVTERPSTLAAFLSRTFGLNLANRTEACAWLGSDGWDQLESWLAAHRNDRPRRAAAPPKESR